MFDRDVRVVEKGEQAPGNFTQVVRRNVCGHTDRDSGGAVEEQVGDARREDHRFQKGVVVVGLEGHRFLFDIPHEFHAQFGHADFRITHGSRGIAVDGSEIALAVDERVAHGKILGHADGGIVDGGIAVRVILTYDIADDAGRFLVGLVVIVAEFVHGVENAPVHGFESVPHIRDGPPDDDAHGVVEV